MINALVTNLYLLSFLTAILAFVLAVRIYPVIIYTVRAKNLMDEPENRSSHKLKTATLGGVGLFIAFFVALVFFGVLSGLERPDLIKLLTLALATIILLFLGIKDDLIALAPKKKFLGQLFVSGLVIFLSDIRIVSLEGLLGVGALPYLVSVFFTIFVFILVINAFNLIDGIDGLGGTIALISSLSFGIFALLNNNTFLALISFSVIGAIVGFLIFNFSSSKKLFMGDSGSLFLGFLLAYQGVYFLQLNAIGGSFSIPNAPVFLLAVLSFPLLDTLRVFVIRAKEGRSPFSPDRNHIHHILIDRALSHKQATILLAIVNVLVIELAILLKDLEINIQLICTVGLGSLMYTMLYRAHRPRESEIAFDNLKTQKNQGRVIKLASRDNINTGSMPRSAFDNQAPVENSGGSSFKASKVKDWFISDRRINELDKMREKYLGASGRDENHKSFKSK